MVHGFNFKQFGNGNCAITFKEDNKNRSILFDKDTPVYDILKRELSVFSDDPVMDLDILDDNDIKSIINVMRTLGYIFKSNPNNVSIFRPIKKLNK